ncbi:MAG TPA: OsmC family protein [Bacteroidales bacterium]|nr:OsmC family protein [Bacteroidales bacterium]HPT22748.1 OsmC family protein [Bacteroidales bacterium]
MDKSKEVSAGLKLVNDRVKFIGTVDNNQPISIDYIPPLGDNTGYTSLELLLLSLSSCVGTSVLTFLRRMHKTINGFEVKSSGIRKEEHPTGFSTIFLEIILASPDVSDDDMNKVIKMSEETYCPVWSMLKGNTNVEVRFSIIKN